MLTDAYQRAFRPFGLSCGQLLIGQHDFDVRLRTLNLRATLSDRASTLIRRADIVLELKGGSEALHSNRGHLYLDAAADPSSSTPAPASPTATATASAPRWASARAASTPAARWAPTGC